MRVPRQISKRKYVIVVGCGNFGSHIANTLSAGRSAVVVIDRDARSFDLLSADFSGFTIEGDAAELAVLETAKTADADLFISASSRDNLNIFIAQVARIHFGVPDVVARVVEPELGSFYGQLGIRTVCPTTLSLDHFLKPPSGDRRT
jgi:trk system potassium uptake protein TrkA